MTSFPQNLLSGYQTFRADRFAQEKQRYQALAERGQKPTTMIVACCDSRAAPETIFNAAPGEIFVLRNVANLVPPYQPDREYHGTSAALEFAVQSLKVKDIVVLGHASCGGIGAALNPNGDPLSPGDFIGKWMELLSPVSEEIAKNRYLTSSERQAALERAAIRHSIENLRTFPYVAEGEAEGRLSLHGAWFGIAEGELWTMDPTSGDFARVTA